MSEFNENSTGDSAEEDPHETFRKYLEAREGAPLRADVKDEVEKDMALARKTGFIVNKAEPSKSEIAKSMPDGGLFETDIPYEELPNAIERLKEAKKIITEQLEKGELRAQITIDEIAEDPEILPEAAREAFDTVQEYIDIDSENLFNLPYEINEFIIRLTSIKERREKTGSDGKEDSDTA